jgi:hypothetical protein
MPHILSAFWSKLALFRDIRGNLRTVLSASEQSQTGFILVGFRNLFACQNLVTFNFRRRLRQKLDAFLLVAKKSKKTDFDLSMSS